MKYSRYRYRPYYRIFSRRNQHFFRNIPWNIMAFAYAMCFLALKLKGSSWLKVQLS